MKPSFPPLPIGLSEVMVLTGHRTVAFGDPTPDFDKIYDKLARRLYVSRDFVKRMTYMIGYGGKVDHWIKHLVETEIEIIMHEDYHGKADAGATTRQGYEVGCQRPEK